jgi:hypothetical protein
MAWVAALEEAKLSCTTVVSKTGAIIPYRAPLLEFALVLEANQMVSSNVHY